MIMKLSNKELNLKEDKVMTQNKVEKLNELNNEQMETVSGGDGLRLRVPGRPIFRPKRDGIRLPKKPIILQNENLY